MVEDAQYEALFAVMFYEGAKNNDSPGFVLAEGVANLYRQLKKNPERYPKGLTVRILLGNPPEPATFELGNQVWHVIRDLREAGLPEMVNDELGWRVEVADFAGRWPHSHTKFVVVDGKTAAAFGFNYQYIHFPFGHPSERGNNRVDPGAHITGPAAQATQSVFDDMWRGASQRYCSNLNPPLNLWEYSCAELKGMPDHVPEVKKYFISEGNSNVFSLYRSEKYRESDDALARAIESSQETIDIFQINFALDLVCGFTPLLGDFCTLEHAPPYMRALLKAITENDAQARVLIYYDGIQAVENEVAMRVLEEELEKQGLSNRLEVRYYNDGDMHSKAFLLDNDFVVVGSQNFHYSAWGDGALTEYNFGTDDLGAIDDYREVFDYHWERGVPRN
jgi:phosphatidylserine/phosphatidylglycerophosphate/cardiolipin synthase-like enzyme